MGWGSTFSLMDAVCRAVARLSSGPRVRRGWRPGWVAMGRLLWDGVQPILPIPPPNPPTPILTLSPGADPQGHPTPFPGHRVAAPVQRHGHASQEPVLGAAQDVLTLREADPQGHCPHLPGARVLQGPGQPGPGSALQRHEGEAPWPHGEPLWSSGLAGPCPDSHVFPRRPTPWWTGRWATARAAPSSWACS